MTVALTATKTQKLQQLMFLELPNTWKTLNIQSLAIEIYKVFNGLSPSFLNKVFHKKISNSYDFEIIKNFIPEILKQSKLLISQSKCNIETLSVVLANQNVTLTLF